MSRVLVRKEKKKEREKGFKLRFHIKIFEKEVCLCVCVCVYMHMYASMNECWQIIIRKRVAELLADVWWYNWEDDTQRFSEALKADKWGKKRGSSKRELKTGLY